MKRINTRRIKAKYSYTIAELAEVIGVHPNTINNWIKQKGLQRIDDAYPYMLYGQVVIDFLKERKHRNKKTLADDELYCCKCQSPQKAWERQAEAKTINSRITLLKAICPVCDNKMNRLIASKNLSKFQNHLEIFTLQVKPLIHTAQANANCETKEQ